MFTFLMNKVYKLFFFIFILQIIAVCDFLNYLRYVERGLVKSSSECFIIMILLKNKLYLFDVEIIKKDLFFYF